VTARGDGWQDVYLDDADRLEFLALLQNAVKRYRWHCHAFCLMGGHYHLLIETGAPTLSKGMKYLNGTYTQYFNRRHHRAGPCFRAGSRPYWCRKKPGCWSWRVTSS